MIARLLAVALVLGLAACTTAPRERSMVAGHQPASGPYPYNSTICP